MGAACVHRSFLVHRSWVHRSACVDRTARAFRVAWLADRVPGTLAEPLSEPVRVGLPGLGAATAALHPGVVARVLLRPPVAPGVCRVRLAATDLPGRRARPHQRGA